MNKPPILRIKCHCEQLSRPCNCNCDDCNSAKVRNRDREAQRDADAAYYEPLIEQAKAEVVREIFGGIEVFDDGVQCYIISKKDLQSLQSKYEP